jgi:two-component system chemotaxis response regulator CheB
MSLAAQSPTPLVVIGASAGGVEAIRDVTAALPVDLPACVLVVLHVPPTGSSALPSILNRSGPLEARHAMEGDTLQPGTILVAPPDHHLIVADGGVTLSRGPTENGHRPAVDVLFRSAARARDGRVIAVVLSGSLDDGAAGMVAVKQRGGVGFAQDFSEALHDGMPRAAAATGVDGTLPVKEIALAIVETVLGWSASPPPEPAPQHRAPTRLMHMETDMANLDPDAMHHHDRPGEPSGYACPDCHGALFEIIEGELVRFRCRVGHAWSPESLVARQTVSLESALWMALRTLEEKAALHRQLADRASERGHDLTSARFLDGEREALAAAELVRELVGEIGGEPAEPAS